MSTKVNKIYDVAIIGAGIGGYVSAIRSSQLGMRVALIEKQKIGGVCLNKGCIPTLTFVTAANLLKKIRHAKNYGINIENLSIDFKRLKARKEAIINRLSQGVRYLLKKNEVDIFEGFGRIKSRNQISIVKNGKEKIIEAKNIIVASGSKPKDLLAVPLDGEKIMAPEDSLNLEELPKEISIIGGGILGVEFAQIFNLLGANVSILEKRQRLLPYLDEEISITISKILERSNIKIYTKVTSESAKIENNKVNLTFYVEGERLNITSDKVIVAVGREPNSENLGLENIGVHLKNGFIEVDEHMRTNIPNIYAVGDVTGGKMFAHTAFAEGVVAAENIAGMESSINRKVIPTCIYTMPEIASVGLSEAEAIKLGYKISVGRFPYMANGRAITLGEREGFVKIIAEKETDEILGVHIIGPDATNLISEAIVAIKLECTSEELGKTIHPHPTLSEAIMEASLAIFKKAIHI